MTTLANVTGLPAMPLSAMVGRLCAIISIIIPGYLIVVMAGRARALEVLPAIVACGVVRRHAVLRVELHRSGAHRHPQLADLHHGHGGGAQAVEAEDDHAARGRPADRGRARKHSGGEIFMAWLPYLLLVVFVLTWGEASIKAAHRHLDQQSDAGVARQGRDRLNGLIVPGLHNMITRVPPVAPQPAPYAAVFTLNWLSASGTACFLATLAAALLLGVPPRQVVGIYRRRSSSWASRC